jgi:hypothetical protein
MDRLNDWNAHLVGFELLAVFDHTLLESFGAEWLVDRRALQQKLVNLGSFADFRQAETENGGCHFA